MSKTIHVSLDQSVSPAVLKLEHYGHAHIDKASTPQTITWKLKGVLSQSELTANSFRWLGTPPPPGIFGSLIPGPNGNSLSMTDLHQDDNSNGDWPYELSVEYNGTTYSCPSTTASAIAAKGTSAALLLRDPIIINH